MPLLALAIIAPLALTSAAPRPLDPPPLTDRAAAPMTDGKDWSPPAEERQLPRKMRSAMTDVRSSAPDATLIEMTCGTLGIRGLGPFDLTCLPTGWSGAVDGTRRTLVMRAPEKLIRPMPLLDGQVWASGIPDEPIPWRGHHEPQFGLAAGVTGGHQGFKVVEWQWPVMPPIPARAALKLGFKS